MILVTGATGTVGSEVVKQLAEAGHEVTALVRASSRTVQLRGPKVRCAVADMSDPAAVHEVFARLRPSRVFLLSPDVVPATKLAMEATVIDQAARAGVEHIVYLSVAELDDNPQFAFRRWHQRTEQLIEATGIAWTHLRPVAFTTNVLLGADSIRTEGAFYLPAGKGKIAPVDPKDIAAVAVKALTEPGHANKAYQLTGPEALTHAELATQLGAVLGRPVRYVDVPAQAALAAVASLGAPASVAEALIEFYTLVSAGRCGFVTPYVEQITGRLPRSFTAWARENTSAFEAVTVH